MSLRQQRQEAKQASTQAAQLQNFAFTIGGYGMRDGIAGRDVYEVICAYPKSTKPFKSVIAESKLGEHISESKQPLFKESTTYTTRELGPAEVGVHQYLVVGYALRSQPQGIDLTKKIKSLQKQKPVGVTEPKEEDIFKWDDAQPPVFVVTEIVKTQPEGIQLYALLNPKNGLCTPHSIAQDQVFYRHEFRDGTTDKKSRGPAWNGNVAQHSVRPGIDGAPLS